MSGGGGEADSEERWWSKVIRTEFCKMCTEYSADEKCEYMESCELQEKLQEKFQKIFEENKRLRAENKKLRKKIEKMETDKSWADFPDMMGK